MNKLQYIKIKDIKINPKNQPRGELKGIDGLAKSIKAVGVQMPLRVVEATGGKFVLVDGHRRVAAARQAKLTEVPAIIDTLERHQLMIHTLIANTQQDNLTRTEAEQYIQELLFEVPKAADLGVVADSVGVDEGAIKAVARGLKMQPKLPKNAPERAQIDFEALELMGDLDDAVVEQALSAESIKAAHKESPYANPVITCLKRAQREAAFERLFAPHIKEIQAVGAKVLKDFSWEWSGKVIGNDEVLSLDNPCGCEGFAAMPCRDFKEIIYVCTKPKKHKLDCPEAQAKAEARAEALRRKKMIAARSDERKDKAHSLSAKFAKSPLKDPLFEIYIALSPFQNSIKSHWEKGTYGLGVDYDLKNASLKRAGDLSRFIVDYIEEKLQKFEFESHHNRDIDCFAHNRAQRDYLTYLADNGHELDVAEQAALTCFSEMVDSFLEFVKQEETAKSPVS